jgi:hypothetical protein
MPSSPQDTAGVTSAQLETIVIGKQQSLEYETGSGVEARPREKRNNKRSRIMMTSFMRLLCSNFH